MLDFGITASSFGVMSAFYLFAYTPMQLPVGVLIDWFGVKKLLSGASLVCGLGAIAFSLAQTATVASFGRLLIGGSSAFAFVSMVYITSHWFPKKKRALLIGLANSIAMVGASFGGGPLASLIKLIGWRVAIFGFGLFGILLAIFIYVVIRSDDKDKSIEDATYHKPTPLKTSLKSVFSNWKSWINALVAISLYMTTTAFAGLWAVSFIQEAHHVTKTVAGYCSSIFFLGWLVGGPIIGLISDRLNLRMVVLRYSIVFAAITLAIILFITNIPLWSVFALMFILGVFSSAELLNFSISIEVNAAYVKATAAAFTNFMVSVGDSIAQPLIGFLLDMRWQGTLINGIRKYSLSDYQFALAFLPVVMIVGFFISFILKSESCETH